MHLEDVRFSVRRDVRGIFKKYVDLYSITVKELGFVIKI